MHNGIMRWLNSDNRWLMIYSLVVVLLVPVLLILNTVWNLRSFDRDLHFAVREEALTINRVFGALTEEVKLGDVDAGLLHRVVDANEQVMYMTLLKTNDRGQFVIQASTYDGAEQDMELPLNQLAWADGGEYLAQVYDPYSQQNLWALSSVVNDAEGKPWGLLITKVNSQRVNKVMERTNRDSLVIMAVSVVVLMLLLANHLRFFERSIMYDKLKEIDQMKDDFVSVASHELKTPLTAIKSYLYMVEKEMAGQLPEKVVKRLEIMKVSVGRLESLVHDLLNVSKLEQNKLDMSLSVVETNAVIQEIVDQLLPTAETKNLALVFEPTVENLKIMAQPDRLREVLINLIGNAIKYTPIGSVTVTQVIEKNKLQIMVKDTGIGIAPEDKAKLFQKFSRIKAEDHNEIPGTGLGLWITKKLVEKMKGEIYVDSIMEQGTVFTLMFGVVKE